MPSSPIPKLPRGKKEPSPKEPAPLLPYRSYWNTNQGRQNPESLSQAGGPRLGKEEFKIHILSEAHMAPPSAFLPAAGGFSFAGTGGIDFLCHFGGCLPCQRLFCRVKEDKKVVSRLFGGGREDCLVRERGPLRAQHTQAALPLRPLLQEMLVSGMRLILPCLSPFPVFLRYIYTVLATREAVAAPGVGSVSPGIWEMRLMHVQSNISAANLDVALATIRALFAGYMEKKAGTKPRAAECVHPQHTNSLQCYAEVQLSSSRPYIHPSSKQMKVACTNMGQSRHFALNDNMSSFTRTSPWRQPDNCPVI